MAIDQATKTEWLEKFQGATLTLDATFGSPKVNHMFRRNFDQMGRNAFFISVRGRVLLGEDQVSAAEQMIYDRITEITKTIERKTEATKVIQQDGQLQSPGKPRGSRHLADADKVRALARSC